MLDASLTTRHACVDASLTTRHACVDASLTTQHTLTNSAHLHGHGCGDQLGRDAVCRRGPRGSCGGVVCYCVLMRCDVVLRRALNIQKEKRKEKRKIDGLKGNTTKKNGSEHNMPLEKKNQNSVLFFIIFFSLLEKLKHTYDV